MRTVANILQALSLGAIHKYIQKWVIQLREPLSEMVGVINRAKLESAF